MKTAKTSWKWPGLALSVLLLAGIGAGVFFATRRPDPGLRLSREELRTGNGALVMASYWRVTNVSDGNVILKRVVYNGEFDAQPVWEPKTAKERSERSLSAMADRALAGQPSPPTPPAPSFPIPLTVGESIKLLERDAAGRGCQKEVVYIDVYTARGRFRYRPASQRFE